MKVTSNTLKNLETLFFVQRCIRKAEVVVYKIMNKYLKEFYGKADDDTMERAVEDEKFNNALRKDDSFLFYSKMVEKLKEKEKGLIEEIAKDLEISKYQFVANIEKFKKLSIYKEKKEV